MSKLFVVKNSTTTLHCSIIPIKNQYLIVQYTGFDHPIFFSDRYGCKEFHRQTKKGL